ncbi:MAG: HypC/HybG/HupF family hydrogenase formation chaperone [Pseudomonadota bacterium]
MCLALPVKVLSLEGPDQARVSVGGIVKTIDTSLVDELEPGDYVILHVGYALSKVDPEAARETLALMEAGAGQVAAQLVEQQP